MRPDSRNTSGARYMNVDLPDELVEQIRQLAEEEERTFEVIVRRAIRHYYGRETQNNATRWPLGKKQEQALAFIRENPGNKTLAIAEAISMNNGNATTMLRQLEHRQLIRCVDSPRRWYAT
jgi:hypothetical protein